MTHYIYKVSDSRIASILSVPFLFLSFMLYVIFDGKNGPDNFWELSIILLAAGIFTIPALLLLLNHYKYSKETILEIVNKKVIVHAGNETVTFNFDEIEKIVEYGIGSRSTIHRLLYWKITTADNFFYISNIIISKSDFDRFFWNKIEEKTKVWPKIHPKAIEPVRKKLITFQNVQVSDTTNYAIKTTACQQKKISLKFYIPCYRWNNRKQ